MGLINKVDIGIFVACGIWCLADVSSVSPSSEQTLVDQTHIQRPKTSFEKNCFSAWASTLNMGLINKVDMVCLSPVGYGV